jgi:hypothetical protein
MRRKHTGAYSRETHGHRRVPSSALDIHADIVHACLEIEEDVKEDVAGNAEGFQE